MISDLLHFTKQDLVHEIKQIDEKTYRAKQIWQWFYRFGCFDFIFLKGRRSINGLCEFFAWGEI